MKRRQEAAEEAERQRLQAEQDARAAAEAQAEAARLAEAKDAHDAPGSPQREQGNNHSNFPPRLELTVRNPPSAYTYICIIMMYQYRELDTCKHKVLKHNYKQPPGPFR